MNVGVLNQSSLLIDLDKVNYKLTNAFLHYIDNSIRFSKIIAVVLYKTLHGQWDTFMCLCSSGPMSFHDRCVLIICERTEAERWS